MNLINSLFEVFKTLVYFIQFIIVFRNEIWAIKTSSLDNYFKTQKIVLFFKNVYLVMELLPSKFVNGYPKELIF